MAPVARQIDTAGLSSTIAWSRREPSGELSVVDAVEGNIAVTGASIDWLASIIGHAGRPEHVLELAGGVEGTEDAYWWRCWPGWALPIGIRRREASSAARRVGPPPRSLRAAVEAVASVIGDVLDALEPALDHPISASLPTALRSSRT